MAQGWALVSHRQCRIQKEMGEWALVPCTRKVTTVVVGDEWEVVRRVSRMVGVERVEKKAVRTWALGAARSLEILAHESDSKLGVEWVQDSS